MGGVALGPIGAIVGLSLAGVVGAGVGIGFAVKNYKDNKRAQEDAARATDDQGFYKSCPHLFCPYCGHDSGN